MFSELEFMLAQVLPEGRHSSWEWFIPNRPEMIYAAVVGAGSAIVSAFLVNKHARKLHIAELKHDTEQKEFERLHSLRRELYLPLADSMARASDSIVKLVDSRATEADYCDPLIEFNRLLSKVTLVGSPAVIEASTKLYARLQRIVGEMLPFRARMEMVAIERTQKQEFLKVMAERQKFTSEQLVTGKVEAAILPSLNDEFHQLKSEIDGGMQQLDAIYKEESRLQTESHKALADRYSPVSELLRKALIVIRPELGLPRDDGWVAKYEAARAQAARELQN
jgi:hypothetical protein